MAKNRRRKSKKNAENYEVGYGKPPKEHQWKKGEPSPNPKGRPKKIKNIKEALQICLDKEINARDENGQLKKISCLEALANRTVADAISKDGPTRRMLYRDDLLSLETKEQEFEEEVDTADVEKEYGEFLRQWVEMPPNIRKLFYEKMKEFMTKVFDKIYRDND